LAYLGLIVAVRVDALRENWHTTAKTMRYGMLLFCVGGMLIIAGWVSQMLWGWAVPDIIKWPDNPITIPEYSITLELKAARRVMLTKKYGLYLTRTGWVVGLDITANDEQGQPLSLLSSSRDKLRRTLQVILTGTPPEAFFLISESELVFRIHQLDNNFNAPIFAQVFRSASGELLAEVPLVQEEDLVVENTLVAIKHFQLPQYRATYNPGAPIESAGIIMLLLYVFIPTKINIHNQQNIYEFGVQNTTG
jgi:hypothetical protein